MRLCERKTGVVLVSRTVGDGDEAGGSSGTRAAAPKRGHSHSKPSDRAMTWKQLAGGKEQLSPDRTLSSQSGAGWVLELLPVGFYFVLLQFYGRLPQGNICVNGIHDALLFEMIRQIALFQDCI